MGVKIINPWAKKIVIGWIFLIYFFFFMIHGDLTFWNEESEERRNPKLVVYKITYNIKLKI